MLTLDFDRLGVNPGDVVADVGAGAGRHAYEAARLGATVLAVDLGLEDLATVRDTLAVMAGDGEITAGGGPLAGDALRLPLADGSVDRVVAAEILEHVDDDLGALTELHRVLRPGGTLAVTVPSWLPEWVCWQLSAEYHAPAQAGGHVRIYTRTVLENQLRRAGFVPTGHHRAHGLHSPYWWLRCAVGPDDPDHPVVKPYRKLLEWDIMQRPLVTRVADAVTTPVLGKSLVVYATTDRA